jgi:hypothetical protein
MRRKREDGWLQPWQMEIYGVKVLGRCPETFRDYIVLPRTLTICYTGTAAK